VKRSCVLRGRAGEEVQERGVTGRGTETFHSKREKLFRGSSSLEEGVSENQ